MRNTEWVGKRNSARQNCQMRGELRFLDGRDPIECKIVDISASGCRIELIEDFVVPEDFDLFIPSRSETKIAKIRRQDGIRLGVAFLKSRLDDPLVMQTLLERVARLERGYSELKGFVAPADPAEKRGASELARPAEAPLPVETGPLVEHRLKALAEGLADLRNTVGKIAVASPAASLEAIAGKTETAVCDIAGLREEMNSLSKSMRGLTSGTPAESADHSADIAAMKSEMTKLSVAMRNMAGEMPKSAARSAPAAATGADTFQLAKIKADIAQLRADVDVQQGGDSAAAPMAKRDELAVLRAEITQLSAALQTLADPAPALLPQPATPADYAKDIDDLKLEVSKLRDTMGEIRAAGAAPKPAPQPVPVVEDKQLAALKGEIAMLRETLRASLVAPEKAEPREVADLRASVQALILLVSQSLGQARDAA